MNNYIKTYYMNKQEHTAIKDGMSQFERIMKRGFDIILSSISLIIFAIPMSIIYLAIKFDDHGKAIFSQERIGRGGRPFKLYKFRSMREDAEGDGQARLCNSATDPRLTKTGAFIRAHHLDELPQIWNVLRGDMSFVGPRPERQYFINKIMKQDPRYADLFQIDVGVFSEATLYNGYTDTMEKMLRRLEMDLAYMQKRNFWTDIKIIFLTSASIITGKKF